MFSVVLLKNIKKILVIKENWLKNYDDEKELDYGLVRKHRITKKNFYSPNRNDYPDFSIEERNEFDETRACCYQAYVYKHFSEYFFCFAQFPILFYNSIKTLFPIFVIRGRVICVEIR